MWREGCKKPWRCCRGETKIRTNTDSEGGRKRFVLTQTVREEEIGTNTDSEGGRDWY